MKKLLIFATILASSVFCLDASTITFSATGYFCAGSGPCSSLNGASSLTIGSYPNETFIGADPTTGTSMSGNDVDLLDITIADIGTLARFATGSFSIDIVQTQPTSGTGIFTGALGGNFAVGSGGAVISFASQSVEIGGITYALKDQVYNFPTIGPPSRIDHILVDMTQGDSVRVSAAPEPGGMALALIGCVFVTTWVGVSRIAASLQEQGEIADGERGQ